MQGVRKSLRFENFLEFNFFPRFGGGIGMTRMARAYELLQKAQEKIYETVENWETNTVFLDTNPT